MQLRKFDAELRQREARESTEVLMSALQAMQDKNTTLEKNLSAETRVKLDLFSALGEAKRQLEIRDSKCCWPCAILIATQYCWLTLLNFGIVFACRCHTAKG